MRHEATLIDSRLCAPHTKRLIFRVEDCERFDFRPGQYVSLTHSVQGVEITRPYSIASPPRGDNTLELCLNVVETSRFAKFLFQLPAGERVRLEGPSGDFGLRTPPRDSLFIATGTGIAPVRSMLQHLVAVSAVDTWLLFGVRFEKGILFREEFERLAAEHPNFRFIPTLSRPGEGWHGATGYVQEHLERTLNGRRNVDAYICGLKAMVDEVARTLEQLGFPHDSIRYEKYD